MYTILVHHPNRLKYLGPLGTISVHDFRTCFFFRKFTKYCHADAESDSGLDEPHVFKMNNGKSTSPKIAVATSDSQPSLRGGRFFKERSTENGELPQSPQGNLSPSSSSQPYERDWFEWYRAQIDENSLCPAICAQN